MDFLTGLIEGSKESESLNVIHVQMAQEDVYAPCIGTNGCAESSYSRPGVKYQQRPVRASLLDA